ncbi:Retrovirus-related Pol polyprotein from transposon RE1 [Vitis vinifera]|uniref:Retrovirus-related Pol polyprotein from transposon RE1 n=1 Tax=Vitis vinifera TaxID=29760 RepID=A0A438DB64_VITVI|nr:Retrovirus-related Pol polyprotein from transposon RE1 [Vitis vinifera]
MGSKWVFQTKYLPDGSIECLKARLVAKGDTQVPGLNYTDTFSPVIKATTVRVVLSLTVTNKWFFRQLDVKNAFLNGHLTKHVYMEQPPSRADTSLFVFHRQSDIIYLLLYVDDIIITSNNSSLLDSFSRKLNTEFATKDLGSLSYFLAQLLDSKPIHTPMVVSKHLSSDGPLFSNPTLYRSLVGALQYFTITRPDIAHTVNSISQFLHSPTEGHFLAVKGILRYVKDWAGCPNTRRSISGYSIYLGDNLVSWSAKKQPTISCSSCESEYHELLWLTYLLSDLIISLPQQPLLLCDNKSAIFLSSNPISHKRPSMLS